MQVHAQGLGWGVDIVELGCRFRSQQVLLVLERLLLLLDGVSLILYCSRCFRAGAMHYHMWDLVEASAHMFKHEMFLVP